MDKLLFFVGLVTILSALSIRVSQRFKVPILLIYLVFGMIMGQVNYVRMNLTNFHFAQSFGIISLCYILFSGAFETNLSVVKKMIRKAFLLSSVGVCAITFTIGFFVYFIIPGFTWPDSFLLGAIISCTDAAAVMAILHMSKAFVPTRIKNLLKIESGSNDPMTYALVIFFLSIADPKIQNPSALLSIAFLIVSIILGFLLGIIFGKLGAFVLAKLSARIFEFDHILILGFVLFTYATTNMLHGNGFLSVYIFGLYLGKSNVKYKNSTIRFYNTLSWIMQIGMFITLGLLTSPKELLHVWQEGLVISLILIFIARPLSVYLSLFLFKNTKLKDIVFLSWGGLKGAVPIIFATYPVVSNIPGALTIFHVVFFVVIFSVLIQGTFLDTLIRFLKFNTLEDKDTEIHTEMEADNLEELENHLIQIVVVPKSIFIDLTIKELKLPQNTLIISIKRDESYFNPVGDTKILEGDLLFFLANDRKEFMSGYLRRKYKDTQTT